MALVSCSEKAPSQNGDDKNYKLELISGSYESCSHLDTIRIDDLNFKFKKGINNCTNPESDFEKSISTIQFNQLFTQFEFNKFLMLDTLVLTSTGEYPGHRDEALYYLTIQNSKSTKRVHFGGDSIPPVLTEMLKGIFELKAELKN